MSSANNDANDDVKLSLKVMMDKERTKVLFAVADNFFTDILLSFLTLPLGRIVRLLKNYYGEKKAPTIGSLTTLYNSLANLDDAHFVTKGAKETLLNPTSSFHDEYEKLKVDITDSPPAEYFTCSNNNCYYCRAKIRYRRVSIYYDNISSCRYCDSPMRKEVDKKGSDAAATSDGVLTIHKASFTISDDLQIFPNETGLLHIISHLGITDLHKAEEIQVAFGLNEIMKLLKASLTSPTPLSDVILNKTAELNNTWIPLHGTANEENPNSKNLSLRLTTQKSTCKVLYAQAKEDFVEFLFGFFNIPLGGVEHLLAGETHANAINNLYRSTTDSIGDEHFKSRDLKKRLMNPNLPHGCIAKNQIFPLVEEGLPADYTASTMSWFSCVNFPKGQGKYLIGPLTYYITDDLTVTPFCAVSALSSLNSLKIPVSDVQEMEVQIGLKEALSILKASLTSTSALTDALLTQTSIKQPKREV